MIGGQRRRRESVLSCFRESAVGVSRWMEIRPLAPELLFSTGNQVGTDGIQPLSDGSDC